MIESPDSPQLRVCCEQLADQAAELDRTGNWPAAQLSACARHGVFRWFVPRPWGCAWNDNDIARAYFQLAASCLTTTFILTQWVAACRRLVAAENSALKELLLPGLANGETFVTVGISHLSTSRQHATKPVLAATETDRGFLLDGYSPWVTGGRHAQYIVLGATLADGRQILVAAPADLPGMAYDEPARLVALNASHTGAVRCQQVHVERRWLLAGPTENIMRHGGGATGGLQTSALAIGLAGGAIRYLAAEATRRPEFSAAMQHLRAEHGSLADDLLRVAAGDALYTTDELRTRANDLALRATQATLAAAKGAGYLAEHPAGRWCREALFFLVWSCPPAVAAANLCQWAGIES